MSLPFDLIELLREFDAAREVPGGKFEEFYSRRLITKWEGVPVTIVSLGDLVQLKRSSGRPQDLVDADLLEAQKKLVSP